MGTSQLAGLEGFGFLREHWFWPYLASFKLEEILAADSIEGAPLPFCWSSVSDFPRPLASAWKLYYKSLFLRSVLWCQALFLKACYLHRRLPVAWRRRKDKSESHNRQTQKDDSVRDTSLLQQGIVCFKWIRYRIRFLNDLSLGFMEKLTEN